MLFKTTTKSVAEKIQVKQVGPNFFMDPMVGLHSISKIGSGVEKVVEIVFDVDEKYLKAKIGIEDMKLVEKVEDEEVIDSFKAEKLASEANSLKLKAKAKAEEKKKAEAKASGAKKVVSKK